MSDKSTGDSVQDAGQKVAQVVEGATSTSGDHSLFDKAGAVGKHFQADGAIGSVGESIGGPLSSEGAVGKQFTTEGAVGGAVQKNLGDQK